MIGESKHKRFGGPSETRPNIIFILKIYFGMPQLWRIAMRSGFPALQNATGIFHSRNLFRVYVQITKRSNQKTTTRVVLRLEGPVRLELTTPCLKGKCSNRLSYGPVKNYVFVLFCLNCKSFDLKLNFFLVPFRESPRETGEYIFR